MIRLFAALAAIALAGCGQSYSPDSYATNAVQQANNVEPGVIVGVRPVAISAQGTVGGVTGAAAGGVAGSQLGVGATSAFTAIGGTLLGGLAGVTAEHIVGDTNGFEYIVRKPNGDMVSVAQKDKKSLPLGQKVLVIAGVQARIVPDYTVPAASAASGSTTPAPSGPVNAAVSPVQGGANAAPSAEPRPVQPLQPDTPSGQGGPLSSTTLPSGS